MPPAPGLAGHLGASYNAMKRGLHKSRCNLTYSLCNVESHDFADRGHNGHKLGRWCCGGQWLALSTQPAAC